MIHAGNIEHLSQPLKSGKRINLVLWFKTSSSFEVFEKFPLDIQSLIVGHLEAGDLCSLERVSKNMQKLVNNENIWKSLALKHYKSKAESILVYEKTLGNPSKIFGNWKENFRMCHIEYLAALAFARALNSEDAMRTIKAGPEYVRL